MTLSYNYCENTGAQNVLRIIMHYQTFALFADLDDALFADLDDALFADLDDALFIALKTDCFLVPLAADLDFTLIEDKALLLRIVFGFDIDLNTVDI